MLCGIFRHSEIVDNFIILSFEPRPRKVRQRGVEPVKRAGFHVYRTIPEPVGCRRWHRHRSTWIAWQYASKQRSPRRLIQPVHRIRCLCLVLCGSTLLEYIREDLGPRELVHPLIAVNYRICKKIRVFHNSGGVDTLATMAPGLLTVNHFNWAIQPSDEYADERSRALELFKAIKRGERISLLSSVHGLSIQANPFALSLN